jgi:2-polyprenyl-3-methyl-5-hydroxy-6-metoxy-1,4-benzoquinol methylase
MHDSSSTETHNHTTPLDDAIRTTVVALRTAQEVLTSGRDPQAEETLSEALNNLEQQLHRYAPNEHRQRAALMGKVTQELHPLISRAPLARRALRCEDGGIAPADILAQINVSAAAGDDPYCRALNRVLLDLPTCVSLRAHDESLLSAIESALLQHADTGPIAVTLINVGTGVLAANLIHALAPIGAKLTVIDGDRDALTFLDMGMTARPRAVELDTLFIDILDIANGTSKDPMPAADLIIVHGMLTYLPDPVARDLIKALHQHLNAKGHLVISTIPPTQDQEMFELLLRWPMIRRTAEMVSRLFRAADLPVPEDFSSNRTVVVAHQRK